MLHRSNAESALWKGRRSRGEAAGQSREGRRGRRGTGTWPGAIFGPGRRPPEGREDLPGSLRKLTEMALSCLGLWSPPTCGHALLSTDPPPDLSRIRCMSLGSAALSN
jgi:hypothetical protein